jgi:hypothetical protein
MGRPVAGVCFRQTARPLRHLPLVAPSEHQRSKPANLGVEVAWIRTALYRQQLTARSEVNFVLVAYRTADS